MNVFRNFLDNEFERTKAIVEDYDYEDGYVVVVYQLNDKYKKDFKFQFNYVSTLVKDY